ncbi:hypothetical protein [Calycomorphotria hydatis]|uniref:Uncharacterized protein n=1 Tax=Calycomorphotria hydatis TaxID=2528027 RepID=A0A517T7T8_9PLAN|nr:hypothetical protein [Calycomorphotria hydatis]QDT64443.1 hypothetical protein V22_16770 [Calycomorphotria hydatis]
MQVLFHILGASLFADVMLLFADVDRLAEAGRYLRRSSSPQAQRILFIALLAIGSFWVGLFLWDRLRKKIRLIQEQPLGNDTLFGRLCHAHQLEGHDITVLAAAGKAVSVVEPARIFIDPDLLQKYATQSPKQAATINRLMIRIFGDVVNDARIDDQGDETKETAAEQIPAAVGSAS